MKQLAQFCSAGPVTAFVAALALCASLSGPCRADFDPGTDYGELMIEAAASGDGEAGLEAEAARNEKIDFFGLDEEKISYEDLALLAKVIHTEAGSAWLSMEWKMAVGEVLLNRVASPEFPDTSPSAPSSRGSTPPRTRTGSRCCSPSATAWRPPSACSRARGC